MGATQTTPAMLNPNGLDMTLVATYERLINANLERVWENVLDWEHLPHLHAGSFDHIEVDEAGTWGWRTFSDKDRKNSIELYVADDRSYVSRSYTGDNQSAEIWTYLNETTAGTEIRVDFHLPNIPPEAADKIGERMIALYTTLWNEDEAMMVERQQRLDENRTHEPFVSIGPRTSLTLPHRFQLRGREYELSLVDGSLVALPTICPHLLGPLQRNPDCQSELICPWHGYRFDLSTRECVSPNDAQCRLPPMPDVQEDAEGNLIARLG